MVRGGCENYFNDVYRQQGDLVGVSGPGSGFNGNEKQDNLGLPCKTRMDVDMDYDCVHQPDPGELPGGWL